MTGTPAFVRNGRLDVLAINQLGRALYAPVFDDPARPANLARFNFLNPSSADFYPGWDNAADTSVALLHTEAGRDPYDRGQTMTCYTAEPGTPSEENLKLLASWSATLEEEATAPSNTGERHPAR